MQPPDALISRGVDHLPYHVLESTPRPPEITRDLGVAHLPTVGDGRQSGARCSRDAAEMQPRYSRDIAEMPRPPAASEVALAFNAPARPIRRRSTAAAAAEHGCC